MGEQRHRSDALPHHVAIIMDGNGRWAESRGLEREAGHRAGVKSVRAVVRAAREIGISNLTLYAFSSENWNRPSAEVALLMKLPEEYFDEELPDAIENGIQIRAIGRLERLPQSVRDSLQEAIDKTRSGGKMRLTFALSYGGRQEIVEAARSLLRDWNTREVDPALLDEQGFARYLHDPELPDVDLLIRTGGEKRISNFLIWQIAYAEIHYTDAMWPAFGKTELLEAIHDYQGRERRFGLTSAQTASTPGGSDAS